MKSVSKTGVRLLLVLLLALAHSLPARAAISSKQLPDLVARLEYAWYSGDLNRILDLAARLDVEKPRGNIDHWLKYYSAYGYFRAAKLAGDDYLGEYVERCEDILKPTLRMQPGFAEGFVLAGACAALLAEKRPIAAVLAPSRALRAFKRARVLEPDNPRLKLQQAEAVVGRRALADEIPPAPALLAEAVEIFSEQVTVDPLRPSWGEPEAYFLQARLALGAGNRLLARDAAESALQIAPDYEAARNLIKELRGGRDRE